MPNSAAAKSQNETPTTVVDWIEIVRWLSEQHRTTGQPVTIREISARAGVQEANTKAALIDAATRAKKALTFGTAAEEAVMTVSDLV